MLGRVSLPHSPRLSPRATIATRSRAQLTRTEWDAEPPPPTLHLADTFLASRYGQRQIGRIKPLQAPKRLTEVVQLRHLPVDESAVLAFEQTVPPIDKLLCVSSRNELE